jgi:hypothetical protein
MTQQIIFFQKSLQVSRDTEFYVEFNSVKDCKKAATKIVKGQTLFDLLMKVNKIHF